MDKQLSIRISIAIWFLLAYAGGYAQPVNSYVQDVVLPAPNAAAFGKYTDVPVNMVTGVPSVEVPIYTAQEGPITWPVSMKYHSSGVTAVEQSSWVGLGWSLFASGNITRVIQGLPDDSEYGYYRKGDSMSYQMQLARELLYNKIAQNHIDSEPDLFSFNAGSYSGKFYIDAARKPHVIPRQDLKVEWLITDRFEQFVIIDPNGMRYIFGRLDQASAPVWEYSQTGYEQGNGSITTWYLVAVETYDRAYRMRFSYQPEHYSYKSPASTQAMYSDCSLLEATQSVNTKLTIIDRASEHMSAFHPVSTTIIHGWRLRSVATSTDSILFDAATPREDLHNFPAGTTPACRLDFIRIKTGSYCRKFALSYEYAIDYNGLMTPEHKRLILKSVQESDCSGATVIPPHLFRYRFPLNPDGTPHLPYRITKAVDHWGYFNGEYQNEGQHVNIPFTVAKVAEYGHVGYGSANRDVNPDFAKYGIIEEVVMPTGAKQTFEFESNDYMGWSSAPLRLASLYSCDTNIPGIDCCGMQSAIDTLTFNTQYELDSARFILTLYADSSYASLQNCGGLMGAVEVRFYQNGTNTLAGVFSLNTNPLVNETETMLMGKMVSYVNLSPGIEYRVELHTMDGVGAFELFTHKREYKKLLAGGLRLQSVRISDGLNAANDKTLHYTYHNPDSVYASSGVLIQEIQYASAVPTFFRVMRLTTYGVLVIFHSETFVPMSSFQQGIVMYRNVQERVNNQYVTHHEFDVDPSPYTAEELPYPAPPLNADVYDGQPTSVKQYDAGGNLVAHTEKTGFSFVPVNNAGFIYKISPPFACHATLSPGSPGVSAPVLPFPNQTYLMVPYQIASTTYKLLSETSTLDSVTTTTTYTYDPNERHTGVVGTSVTSSNGKVYSTRNLYVHDMLPSALRDSLMKRNLVGMPIETVSKTNIEVDGTRSEYGFFSKASGASVPSSANEPVEIYPWKFHRFERTWVNGSPTSGAWVLKGTINSYHPLNSQNGKGYPAQFTLANWPSETYEWQNGRIRKRMYQGYVWLYEYHPATRLLSKITQPDGQFAAYSYDALMRLSLSSSRGGKVKTYYQYRYPDLANPYASVTDSTVYNDGIAEMGSSHTRTVNRQYIDGLGRPFQQVAVRQSPAGKDVITAVKYDALGRQTHTYLPFESAQSSGAWQPVPAGTGYTLTEYETSPLSRAIRVTPPDWYASVTEYRTNTPTEAKMDLASSTYFPAGSLFVQTVIDPNGNRVSTYTDKIGLQVLSRKTDSTGTQIADTYYMYDDKKRTTRIVPPGAALNMPDLIFLYTYDGADQVITKKVPDAATVQMRYDTRNQLVLVQDGNLLGQGQNRWLCTNYDDFGRVTKTGFWIAVPGSVIAAGSLTIGSVNLLTQNAYGASGPATGKLTQSSVRLLGTSTWLNTNYFYDTYGRLDSTAGNSALNTTSGSELHKFKYDWADHILSDVRTHKPSSAKTYVVRQWNLYDQAGRLGAVDYQVDNGPKHRVSGMVYNHRNEVIERNLGAMHTGSSSGSVLKLMQGGPGISNADLGITDPISAPPIGTMTPALQSIDYTYNAQGWLRTINQANLGGTAMPLPLNGSTLPNPGAAPSIPDQNDLFFMELNYDQLRPGLPGTPLRNGNIAQIVSRVRGREQMGWHFTYDFLDRLRTSYYRNIPESSGIASSDSLFTEHLTYDLRGNIQTLRRQGLYPAGTGWAAGTIDQLTYSYHTNTNRLKQVADAAPAAGRDYGFDPGTQNASRSYDANGNMTSDPDKNMTISYNHLNKPVLITFNGTSPTRTIEWQYDAAGNKLRKIVKQGTTTVYQQHYVQGIEYRRNGTGSAVIEAIYHPEGRVFYTNGQNPRYEYSMKDHLGNTRLTFSDLNGNFKIETPTEVLQENHYYPFGMSMQGPWMQNSALDNLYQYNGKELNADWGLNWMDYGARMYMADLGRWNGVDAMTETYASWSGYHYVLGNPLKLIDPNGMWADNYYINRDGTIDVVKTDDESDSFFMQNAAPVSDGYYHVGTLAKNENGLVEFPASGNGFERYGPNDVGGESGGETVGAGDHFLQPEAAASLFGVIETVQNEGITMSLGDMSSSNGSDPWQTGVDHHEGHGHLGNRSGLDVDFRYVDANGNGFRNTNATTSTEFSTDKNQSIYNAAARFGFTQNYHGTRGPEMNNASRMREHNDHGHLGQSSDYHLRVRYVSQPPVNVIR